MGKKTPLSPALGGGSRRDDTGGQLLRELEALSQVLYNAGQQNGRPPRKESPSSPYLAGLAGPRRSQEPVSPYLGGRASPHFGSRSIESQPEESSLPSPYLSTYANRRERDSRSEDQPPISPYLGGRKGGGPPSPYLGGLEARSPAIVSLNGITTSSQSPSIGNSGSRRNGGGKPPTIEPKSPQIGVHKSVDSIPSSYLEARRSADQPPRSPYLAGQYSNGLSSPSLRGRRSEGSPHTGAMAEEMDKSYERDHGGVMQSSRGKEPQPPHLGLGSLNITEHTLASAAAALRSPHQRPPPHSRSFSPLSQSEDLGKRIEAYRLDGGRDTAEGDVRGRGLQPWHSQGFETGLPEVTNFPRWLEDNVQFSKQLEAPKEKKSLWNWKPFRAIAHIRQQRFNCMFTVHVHGIEGLPAVTNGLRLAVTWKRKEAQCQSMAARVFQGSAEFEETLNLKSNVYGTKDGAKGMKFEPKNFDLAVIALDVDELVLGKHRLDLSRLLPISSEPRDEENDRTWTTSFKLAGKAKGGTLIVTFGCQLLNKDSEPTSNLSSARFSDSPRVKPLRSYNSLPSSPEGISRGGWSSHVADYSPAMSEFPPDGAEYMKMEHLSLNDEYSPSEDAHSSSGKSSQKGLSRPSFDRDSPGTTKKLSYNQPATTSDREDLTKALYDDDGGSEFTVVYQGREVSAILDTGPPLEYDDPTAEEDTVQGLSDGDADADVHENSVNDSVTMKVRVSMDVLGNVKGSSDGKSPKSEQAEIGDVSLLPVNPQALESGIDEKLPQVGEVLVSDHSLVDGADPALEYRSENSVVGKVSNPGAIEEEREQDIVLVHEDWAEGIVEDLEDLTRSWSVGEPASTVEEHVICREESLSDDNEDENTTSVIFVESKEDDKTENVIVVDSEEDEKANVIVVENKEDEKANVVVESKEDEQTHVIVVESKEVEQTDVIVVESKVDERTNVIVVESIEDEKTASGIVVESNLRDVKDIETVTSTLTPSLQVKTENEDEDFGVDEDDYDLVAGEFLSFLRDDRGSVAASSENGEDSPRALLLQQFEQEALIEGGLELNFHLPEYAKFRMEGMQEKGDANAPLNDSQDSPSDSHSIDISDWGNEDDVELAAIMEAAEAELQKATQLLQSKARAKMLEDEETKALMQEWGFNDEAFDAPEALLEPDSSLAIVPLLPAPPLGNGLGPVLHMRDGGSLRSMSPTHFQGGGAVGRLLMQVSNPVVVPSEMGTTSMDILRRMAVAGMEGMATQAMMAMPLEDITGMALDQISVGHRHAGFAQSLGSRRNGFADLGYGEKNALTLRENSSMASYFKDGSSRRNGIATNSNDEYVGLEDLAPVAMLKIEALALEGLKIQAEMADQDAPYGVEAMADEPNHMRAAHKVNKLDGVAGITLLDGGNSSLGVPCAEEDNFMSMAVSLDEWMRLDAGVCGESDTEKQTLAIIAAHNTAHTRDIGKQKDKRVMSQNLSRKSRDDRENVNTGFMGDTITLAMLVQLRDPLRNNEPVGAPTMALVQAERVMVPPKPKLGRRMPYRKNNEEDRNEDARPPQFKIVGITVSGLKTGYSCSTPKTEVWGNKTQLQAGSRWLIAQGMQKSTKLHPALKGKAPTAPQVKIQRGESLWSISVRVHGSGAKWRDLARLNPHIRNPDVIFPDTSMRTE